MGNLHLITGYAGHDHITSADQGAFNGALIGAGQFALSRGNCFEAQVISNNKIRVLDGELMMQGRYIRMNPGTYVDLDISSGRQGTMRMDLIVARYTKDPVTGIEDCNLMVIEGVPTTSFPSDPQYISGDILNERDIRNDIPLYRVLLDGINIQQVSQMFNVKEVSISSVENAKQDKTDRLFEQTALDDGDYMPFYDVSAKAHRKVLWSRIKAVLGNVFAAKEHSHTLSALGAAATSHKHSASDINSGILPVARGGTGVADLGSLVETIHACRVQHGSYVGTGYRGEAYPNSLTFDFIPKIVFIMPEGDNSLLSSSRFQGMVLINGISRFCGFGTFYHSSGTQFGESCVISWHENTVSWYAEGDDSEAVMIQQNFPNMKYFYVAIG